MPSNCLDMLLGAELFWRLICTKLFFRKKNWATELVRQEKIRQII